MCTIFWNFNFSFQHLLITKINYSIQLKRVYQLLVPPTQKPNQLPVYLHLQLEQRPKNYPGVIYAMKMQYFVVKDVMVNYFVLNVIVNVTTMMRNIVYILKNPIVHHPNLKKIIFKTFNIGIVDFYNTIFLSIKYFNMLNSYLILSAKQ